MHPETTTDKYFEEHPDRKVLEDLTKELREFNPRYPAEEKPRLTDFTKHLAELHGIDLAVSLIDVDAKEDPSI